MENQTIEQVPEEIKDVPVETPDVPVETLEVTEETTEETPEQINWKKFRDERKAEREQAKADKDLAKKKAEEAEAFREALEQVTQTSGPVVGKSVEEQVIADLADDDIPMGRDIKGFVAKYVADTVAKTLREREEVVTQQRAEQEINELPQRLRQTHNDFDQVMTQENFDYLEYHHPEMAKAMGYMPKGFDKWNNTYNLIKKLVPNAVNAAQDTRQAQRNLQKPQAPTGHASHSTGELAPGRIITQAERDANYKRLRELARQA